MAVHIAVHDVTPADVYAVLRNRPLFLLNLPDRTASHVMIGEDAKGRVLYVPMMHDGGGRWRVVTAFENRSVRRMWQERANERLREGTA
jgi:hypothetical protein